jgi:fatty acid desaturase
MPPTPPPQRGGNLGGCLLILFFLALFWAIVYFSGLGPFVVTGVWNLLLTLLGALVESLNNIWHAIVHQIQEGARR